MIGDLFGGVCWNMAHSNPPRRRAGDVYVFITDRGTDNPPTTLELVDDRPVQGETAPHDEHLGAGDVARDLRSCVGPVQRNIGTIAQQLLLDVCRGKVLAREHIQYCYHGTQRDQPTFGLVSPIR